LKLVRSNSCFEPAAQPSGNLSLWHPELFWRLTGTLMMSPYEVPDLLPKKSFGHEYFDLVVLLDCAGTTVAENLAGLFRAKQVIGFGDEAISEASGFETEARSESIGREFEASSAFARLRSTFDVEVLRRSYRIGGQALGELVNREFYQNRIVFEPTADEFLGSSQASLELIGEGNRAAVNASEESLDAEVTRVVELVVNARTLAPRRISNGRDAFKKTRSTTC
jgi:hypothetical protein